MSNTRPPALIKAIDAKFVTLGTQLDEARAMLKEGRYANTKNSRRQLMQSIQYLEARLAGQLDIMQLTHNFTAQALTREELYHGTGFAPGALFIQIN